MTNTTTTRATATPASGHWRKSSYSGGGGAGNGDCVEIAHLPGERVAVRDSKNPANVLVFPRLRFGAIGAVDRVGVISAGGR